MTSAGELLLKGDALRQLGRFEEALDLLGRALVQAPDNAHVHAVRSACLRRLGRREEALEAADTAVALAPDSADGHLARARALLDMTGGAPLAVAAAREALRLAPHATAVLECLGLACLSCGDAASAEQVAQALLAGNPDAPEGHSLLGSAAQLRQEWDLAREHLHRTLGLVPEAASVMVRLGVVETHRGDHQAATEWFRRAAGADPGDPAAAARVAGGIHDRVHARLFTGRAKGEAVAMLRALLDAPEPHRPAFVTAMLSALLGTALLSWHEGNPVAHVTEGIALLESLADVDPEAACPAPGASATSGGGGTGGDAEVVARDLQTAAWAGGVEYRRSLVSQWRQDGAEANLVAIAVCGGRAMRIDRCLRLLDACLPEVEASGQPLSVARAHMTAGRAELLRQDCLLRDKVTRSAAHFRAALETFVRLRTVGLRAAAEAYLGDALAYTDPDPEGAVLAEAIELLSSSARIRERLGHVARQPLAVTEAGLGEAYYLRLRAFGDPGDADRALQHFGRSAALFGEVGQLLGQARFLVYTARVWTDRPDGDPRENRRCALAALDAAQRLVTRESAPVRWAMVQADTACVLVDDPSGCDVDRAVELARAAAAVSDRDEEPRDWASHRLVLALALASRAAAGGRDAADQAAESVGLVEEAFPVLVRLLPLQAVAHLHRDAARVLRLAGAVTRDPGVLEAAQELLEQGSAISRTHGYPRPATLLQREQERLVHTRRELNENDAQEALHG